MPELVFRRGAEPPVKMACMYCGRPAAHADARRVANPRRDPPARAAPDRSLSNLARGDDPVSAAVALLVLPFGLLALLRDLRAGWRHRAAVRAAPPLDPPHTVVTVTTCARHRHYGRRFVWAGVAGAAGLAALWGGVLLLRHEPPGAPLWLATAALVGTVAFPIFFLMQYGTAGPVRVAAVTRDAVTLADVRPAYFDAPG